MLNANEIIKLLKDTLKYQNKPIPLHEPLFVGNEWRYVKECLDTGWVSSVGKFVDRFEADLASFTGAKHAIATMNGTAALHICYKLAGVQPQDEVLLPTLTFAATVNALTYVGGIPHFIDTAKDSLNLDIFALRDYLHDIAKITPNGTINKHTQRPLRALCVMHTLGHPVDLDAIDEICKTYQLVLIEDAAESLGSYYKGVHVGHRGLLGALSFNGNKVMTTGGGGAILTNDSTVAKQAKHITTTAKMPHAFRFTHDQIGYNYRLPNINAALGCAQLESLPTYLQRKRLLAQIYQQAFANIVGVEFITEPSYAQSNYWMNAIKVNCYSIAARDTLLAEIIAAGVLVRPFWDLQHHNPLFKPAPQMPLLHAEDWAKRLIQIPSSSQLVSSQTLSCQHE